MIIFLILLVKNKYFYPPKMLTLLKRKLCETERLPNNKTTATENVTQSLQYLTTISMLALEAQRIPD